MNTISRKELNELYLNNEGGIANAKKYFGNRQPSIYRTGRYSSPSWDWVYEIGITTIKTDTDLLYFEVVTQFGRVVSAIPLYLDMYN